MSDPVELGPWLNRLVAPPAPVSQAETLLSDLRLRLLTRLFERPEWRAAWQDAVAEAAAMVSGEVEARFRAAAALSRYPARKLRTILPDSDARGILAARLSACGIDLEESLNQAGTSGPEIRMRCGLLEVAWGRLVATADQELAAADRMAADLRAWRRPLVPLVIASGLLLIVAVWAGLVLGGYLNSPAWFRPIAESVWNR